ncbi:MAG: Dam family site-specific DNA-(adenine-N6)-methyltransferase [Candidatus Magnetoovum sp. WYHC-5]|nr:Dam family site-specific DNA-(adenine-N6)-methyltransferase [Candidatus Magnetoovum sp. WYHC-5]
MKKIHIPPIKCQGIKTKLIPLILCNINHTKNGKWIEPFLGSGVVGFNHSPPIALFADINPHIIDFYNALKKRLIRPETVRSFLEEEGNKLKLIGEEYYYEVRERFNRNNNPLDMLFLNRACFNGIMRFNKKGYYNVPFGHKPNRFSKAYITKIVNQVQFVYNIIQVKKWEFHCQDFREIIAEAEVNDFIYCDPPYIGRHVDYYGSWTEKDEKDIFTMLENTKANFIFSTWFANKYRKNEFIDKYWEKFFIIKNEHFYFVGSKEEYRNSITEALIMNYPPQNISSVNTNPNEIILALF